MNRSPGSVRRRGQDRATACSSYEKILAKRLEEPRAPHPAPLRAKSQFKPVIYVVAGVIAAIVKVYP